MHDSDYVSASLCLTHLIHKALVEMSSSPHGEFDKVNIQLQLKRDAGSKTWHARMKVE